MICIGHHPEVPLFHGLGNLNSAQLEALYPQRLPLTLQQQTAGSVIWQALCAHTPIQIGELSRDTFAGLAFMAPALGRFCREFPHRDHGLTLSQYRLLQAIGEPLDDLPLLRQQLERQAQSGRLPAGETAETHYRRVMNGPLRFGRIFLSLQTMEAAPFMGDLSVHRELATLTTAATPYIRATPDRNPFSDAADTVYALTAAGRAALAGGLHWAEVNHHDCWRGGVHLNPDQMWYWDPETGFTRQAPIQ